MKVISGIVLAGLIACSGCSTPSKNPDGTERQSTWSNYFPAKVSVQLSVINAESKSPVFINGKNIGKANRGGSLSTTLKVKKDEPTEIIFRVKRFTLRSIFRQEELIRQTIKVSVNSIVVCDGKKKTCTVSNQ